MRIDFVVDAGKVRTLASTATNCQYTGEKAEAFLLVHGEQLRDELDKCVRQFITNKLTITL